jgi:membrane protein implicated in regulation of membrane protease activity
MLTLFYWVLVIGGGGFFLISFILGELVDFGGEALDGLGNFAGGIFEGIGGALGGLFEGADAVDVDVPLPDVGGVDFDVDAGPGPFTFRTITMFLSGFGAGGLVGTGMGLSEPFTLIPAFGFGIVAGVVTWQFLRFFYREQASTSIQPTDYIGLIGRVTVSIPEGRLGQVALEVKLQKRNMPARSEDGSPIPTQTQVQVVSMEGGTLVVKKIS